jgi:hypothetical protein
VTETWPKTLYMPCLDFYPEVEDDANRWFDMDHIPERLNCVGWSSCERFQRTGISPIGIEPRDTWPKYIQMFVVEGPEGPRTNAHNRQLVMPGAWRTVLNDRTKQLGLLKEGRTGPALFISRTISGTLRGLWVQRPSPWARKLVSLPPPRSIFVLLLDFDPAHEVELNRYRDEEAVPDLLSCSGFLSCERYEAASLQPTTAAPDRPRYLEIYDVESPEVLSSNAFRRNRAALSEQARRLEALATVWGTGVYLQRPSPWAVRVLE